MKPIFALDASGKTASVCVAKGEQVLFSQVLDEGLTHSQTLLSLVNSAFSATGLAPPDIGVYAVTAGPGSFTGLRIGLSLVKGLALPHGTPVAPISTLYALALASGAHEGIVVTALDARRGEVYWAAFDAQHGFARLCEDAAGPALDIGRQPWFGTAPTVFVGDGREICYTIYGQTNAVNRSTCDGPPPIARGAATAAAAMQQDGTLCCAGLVHPRYLRLSQAERQRASALEAAQSPNS